MLRAIFAALSNAFGNFLRGISYAFAVCWDVVMIPVRLMRAAATEPPSAAEFEVAKAQSEVQRLAAQANDAARKAEVLRVPTRSPAWVVAKDTAKAVLSDGERPDASHLDDRVQAWLAAMTPREARIVREETPGYIAAWLAGRHRIFGLELPSDADVEEFVAGVEGDVPEAANDDGPSLKFA